MTLAKHRQGKDTKSKVNNTTTHRAVHITVRMPSAMEGQPQLLPVVTNMTNFIVRNSQRRLPPLLGLGDKVSRLGSGASDDLRGVAIPFARLGHLTLRHDLIATSVGYDAAKSPSGSASATP